MLFKLLVQGRETRTQPELGFTEPKGRRILSAEVMLIYGVSPGHCVACGVSNGFSL